MSTTLAAGILIFRGPHVSLHGSSLWLLEEFDEMMRGPQSPSSIYNSLLLSPRSYLSLPEINKEKPSIELPSQIIHTSF